MWEFKNNKIATETDKKISSVYGQGVIIDRPGRNWFSKFRSGDMPLKDKSWPERSSDLNQDDLREFVECNPRKNTLELVLDLNTSQSTICFHMKKIGKESMKI